MKSMYRLESPLNSPSNTEDSELQQNATGGNARQERNRAKNQIQKLVIKC